MTAKPNTAVQRMLPHANSAGKTYRGPSGTSYSAVVGTTVDAPAQDVNYLTANGWAVTGSPRDSGGVGATTGRPTDGLYHGLTYTDTTLGHVVVYDGATWRNPVTGAAE